MLGLLCAAKFLLLTFLRHLQDLIGSDRTILRRHIALHIVFRGIRLGLLGEEEIPQRLDAPVHGGGDGLRPLLVDEFLGSGECLPDILVNAVQFGEVQPVKRGHQPQLVLVGSFERLAGDTRAGADLGRQLVVSQAGTAVVNGGWPQPFQGVWVAEQSKIVEVPVLVGDEVVQHQHLVQGVGHVGNTQLFAAVAVVPVDGCLVVLLLGLHHPPGGDELRVRRDEILAHGVGDAIVPHQGVRNVGNPHALGDFSSDHLVERLLQKGKAARLDEAAFAVQNGPPFAEVAVAGPVRGAKVCAALDRLAQQGVAHIRRETVLEEVYVLPDKGAVLGFQPVVVGEAQTQVGFQKAGGVRMA